MYFGKILKQTSFPFVNLIYYKNLLITEYIDSSEMNESNLNEFINQVSTFYQNTKFVKLADIRSSFFVPSPEQKEIIAKHPTGKLIIAEAILVDSISETLQAKNFKYYNKPIFPIEIFKNKNEAIDWLQECYRKSIKGLNSISYG